jgi:glutamate dehydrogenase (NAD(P)+)
LLEVSYLARAMTLKNSFVHIGIGGAKAGITAPESLLSERRQDVLLGFGRSLGPIMRSGLYIPGEDLGISTDDLNTIRRGANLPPVPEAFTQFDGGHITARTVFETVRQTLKHLDIPMSEATFAIEGFGRVGSNLAQLMAAQGATLVAASTFNGAIHNPDGLDVDQLIALRNEYGDQCVEHYSDAKPIELGELLLLDVTVLVPCARPWTISNDNVDDIKAKVIVPGGNIPITPPAERNLFERDVLCLPDFVSNCGAVYGGYLVSSGFEQDDIISIIEQDFAWKVARVLEKAKQRQLMPSEMAKEVAWQNHQELNQEAQRSSSGVTGLAGKVLRQGVRGSTERAASILYRRGWLQTDSVHQMALEAKRKQLRADKLLQ